MLALLSANLLALRRLTIEVKRVACYERIAYIDATSETSVPPSSTARLCEGDSPLIEYADRPTGD